MAGLSGGRTVAEITAQKKEYGLSQIFICIHAQNISPAIIEEIIAFTKNNDATIRYPGEQVLATRKKSLEEGITVNDEIWQQILKL